MICDADILSMFGKVDRTDLLRKLFPDAGFGITFEVYNELLRAKEAGYDFVDDILNCEENEVVWLDVVDILRLCYRKRVLDKREIENLIMDIEEKDRTRITKKGEIFAESNKEIK